MDGRTDADASIESPEETPPGSKRERSVDGADGTGDEPDTDPEAGSEADDGIDEGDPDYDADSGLGTDSGSGTGTESSPEGQWVDRSLSAADPDDPNDSDDDRRTSPRAGPGDDERRAETGSEPASVDPSESSVADPASMGEARTDSNLLERLSYAFGIGRRSGLAHAYDAEEHGPLATFETGKRVEERDRYWVNFPYALVVVLADPTTKALTYRVVEPDLDPVERELLSVLEDDVRDALLYRTDAEAERAAAPEALLRDELDRRLAEYDVPVSPRRFESLFYYLRRSFQGYGPLDPLMHDPHVEDVSCDGYDLPIFVYHDAYDNVETTVSFGERELDEFVVRLAQRSGQHVSLGRPVVEATLPDGSRAELDLGTEVTPRGSAFTIRRYAEDPFTPLDLIETGTFSTEQISYLWLCIEHDRNLLFAGGTASGKTTAMNAVSMFVPPRAKVLTIEDTRELALYHDNWLSSVTRERLGGETDITMYDLLRSALRHRPEYIIVGEVRGKEAMTLFQAMNTGHTTYSTMHADSVRTVINRLENEPINVPRQMVQSLDVLCMQGFANVEGERVRRNRELAEIDGIDERTGELDYSTSFEWTPEGDGHDERGSEVTETIREGQGWSRTDLLRELKRRQDFLDALREHGVEDYRRFTAAVKAYYADPERAVADVEAASRVDDADGTDAETGTRVRKSSEPGEPDEPGDDRPTGERVVDRSVDEPADEPTDTRTADRGPEADPAGARSGADDADRDTDRPDADFGDGR